MDKLEFAEHFAGLLRCCGDRYIASNLEDALARYLEGRPARELPKLAPPAPHDGGWPV